MLQSNIIITKTFLDLEKVKKKLTWVFFNHKNSINLSNYIDEINSLEESEIEFFYNSQQEKGLVVSYDFKEKKEFKNILSDFYFKREEPTILFLGDLSSYSIPLQEGMLRFLEEPPENLFIVLFAKNKSTILPTISSRSQIVILDDKIIFRNLDSKLNELVQKKLPAPKDAAMNLISNNSVNILDIKRIERDELEYWLWQIKSYLDVYFCKKPSKRISQLIFTIHKAIQYNEQNLQKRFVIESLNIN